MSLGLVIGHDAPVAAWAFNKYSRVHTPVDAAVGVVDDGDMVGAAVFQAWTGREVQLSYYGEETVTPGIVRSIARFVFSRFPTITRVVVLTARTNERIWKPLCRMGFQVEGSSRRYYGETDRPDHEAIRLVIFRRRIEEIARLGASSSAVT